jgi:hypothetical protein
MNTDDSATRLCFGISQEDEQKLREIAQRSRDRWFLFTQYFPNGDQERFAHDLLMGWPAETLTTASDCLLMHFFRLDHVISDDDEMRLRNLAERLKSARSTWPSEERYFDVLERAVAEEYDRDRPTVFRIRCLAGRLSDLFIFGR